MAHAVATELQQRGEQVALLANLDAYPWSSDDDAPIMDERELLIAMLDMFECDVKGLESKSLTSSEVLQILHSQGRAPSSIDEYHVSTIVQIAENNVNLAINFTPSVFHGDLLLFIATSDRQDGVPSPDAWSPYVDGVIETHNISSRHDRMTQPESLAQIGLILAAKLERITA